MSTSTPAHPLANATKLGLALLVLLVASLGGGGRGGFGDLLAQLLALMLLAQLCWQGAHDQLSWRTSPWVRWLPMLALCLPLLQLLPIPSAWWSGAPARAELAAQMAQAGVSAIHVISLNPEATERALWSLLPATALFLCTLTLSRAGQYWFLAAILMLAVLNILFGMAQLADGEQSALRLYRPTNPTDAVGFFANRNHLAALIGMALPLALAATAWAFSERVEGRRLSVMWSVAGGGLVVLLVLGIALARSRAGLLLGMVAVLASLPIVMSLRRQRGTRRLLALAVGLAVMLSAQFALFGILQRLDTDPLDDGRWTYARITSEAAQAYAPLGSGLGTFRQAYQPFEAKGEPSRSIINHAHNDYLELWLEGGWPALLLLALGAVAWGWISLRVWRHSPEPGTQESLARLVSRAAWLSASLAILHSALDYPLRTTANMSVFAILVAVAFTESPRRSRSARHVPGALPDQPMPSLPGGG